MAELYVLVSAATCWECCQAIHGVYVDDGIRIHRYQVHGKWESASPRTYCMYEYIIFKKVIPDIKPKIPLNVISSRNCDSELN